MRQPQRPFAARAQSAMMEATNVLLQDEPESGLMVLPDGNIQIGTFTMTPTGLVGQGSKEDWEKLASVFSKLENSLPFYIGDLVVYGEDALGIDNEDLAQIFNRDQHTIENYAWVCRSVSYAVRFPTLTFAHHALVAGFKTEEDKIGWLQYAMEQGLSASRMRQAIQGMPTLPSGAAALADKKHHRTFTRIWNRLKKGVQPSPEDVSALRAWLNELDRKES